MTLLLWIAALIGVWCAASLVAALALGTFLRRRSESAEDVAEALRPLDTGALRMWLAEIPEVPEPRRVADAAAVTG